MTRPPVDPAIAAAIDRERRRLAHARLPEEKALIRASLRRWVEMARQSRAEPEPPRVP